MDSYILIFNQQYPSENFYPFILLIEDVNKMKELNEVYQSKHSLFSPLINFSKRTYFIILFFSSDKVSNIEIIFWKTKKLK
jgi:hypothetical protein